MSYDYSTEKKELMNEDGINLILKIWENSQKACEIAGVVKASKTWAGCTGDSWNFLAALDFLVESGRLRELPRNGCAGQDRTFELSAR